MADPNVTAPLDPLLDIQDLAAQAEELVALAEWIAAANFIVSQVQYACQRSPEAAAIMERYEIPINDIEWDAELQSALQTMTLAARSKLRDVRELASREASHG